jgi:hypothetical protein
MGATKTVYRAQGASNSGNTQQECKPTITLKGAKNENAAQGASNENAAEAAKNTNAAEAAKNTNAAQGASNGKAIHIHIHTGS